MRKSFSCEPVVVIPLSEFESALKLPVRKSLLFSKVRASSSSKIISAKRIWFLFRIGQWKLPFTFRERFTKSSEKYIIVKRREKTDRYKFTNPFLGLALFLLDSGFSSSTFLMTGAFAKLLSFFSNRFFAVAEWTWNIFLKLFNKAVSLSLLKRHLTRTRQIGSRVFFDIRQDFG